MYVKLFASLYHGTLRGNSNGLLVFTNLLAHCDKEGIADIHPRAIAEEVGLPPEAVQAALIELEAPDLESRSPEEEGRRIIRTDEHRAWGWRVVNYGKYRAIRSEEDRREQNRLAQAKFREKSKPSSAKSKPSKPPSAQAEAEGEEEKTTAPTVLVDAYRLPPVPSLEIVQSYREHLVPPLPDVEVVGDSRKRAMSARWREVCTSEKFNRDKGLEWFDWYFSHAAKSRFLTGRAGKDWRADFDFLMTPNKFAKVIEGSYHKDAA